MIDYSRRCDVLLMTPAERAIYDAMVAVENLQADKRLSASVTLLETARMLVADFVDGVERKQHE